MIKQGTYIHLCRKTVTRKVRTYIGWMCKKKDMVNKNTFMHLQYVAYNQDELLIKKLGFLVWL